MNPITIHLHLFIPTLLSLTAFIILLVKGNLLRRKNRMFFKAALIFSFSYALLVGNALGHDIYYQWNVNRYDLNKDGTFSTAETTPEQILAVERLTNDAGRNLAFISSLIVSIMLSVSVYTLMRINHALFESEETEQKNNLTKVHTY